MLPRFLLVVAAGFLLGLRGLEASLADAPEARGVIEQLRPGMTTEEVRKLLREPRQLARQILYRQYYEVWNYSTPPVRILFRAELGQSPQIVTVRLGSAGRP